MLCFHQRSTTDCRTGKKRVRIAHMSAEAAGLHGMGWCLLSGNARK
ncbi:MAG: hypothetical protein HFG79_07450 [Lachnospiraceae bacterium]|nr:hypothetical protein [Lachnospiraceae bacterium]